MFQSGQAGARPFTLLAQAYAGEAQLFTGQRVIHLRNQIIVAPMADIAQARSGGLPLVSLDPQGRMCCDLLSLPAEVNQGYTVEDECWYDPPTARFVRLLTCDGKTLFASAYDGTRIYRLETVAGQARIVSHPVDKGFQPPRNPAEILGIGAGVRYSIDTWNAGMVHDAGKTMLADGTEGRLVRLGSPGETLPAKPYWLVTIRSDNTVEKMEWRKGPQALFCICRAKADPEQAPGVGWNLAGLASKEIDHTSTGGPSVLTDLVVAGISVEQMVREADFAVYTFARDPAWAGSRPIIDDALDLGTPPKRMFTIIYQAKDNRHVVLVQSASYNTALGPSVYQEGNLVYTSPAGVKVWSGPRSPWLAQILLKSAGYYIEGPPSQEALGYVLETPDDTYPTLAINGKITDEELHVLVDSLKPVKFEGSGQQEPPVSKSPPPQTGR